MRRRVLLFLLVLGALVMVLTAMLMAPDDVAVTAPDDPAPEETTGEVGDQNANHDPLVLPSGLRAELQEMIWTERGPGLTYRFRFVAEGFHETAEVEKVMTDLEHLCTNYVLDRLSIIGPTPSQVVVSLADRPSKFGSYDPEVTQVFEAFRIQNKHCIWEEF